MLALPHTKSDDTLRLAQPLSKLAEKINVDLQNADPIRESVKRLHAVIEESFRWRAPTRFSRYYDRFSERVSDIFSFRFPLLEKYFSKLMLGILIVGSLALYLEGFSLPLGLLIAYPTYWATEKLYTYLRKQIRNITNEDSVDNYLRSKENRDELLDLIDTIEPLMYRLEDLSEENLLPYIENLSNIYTSIESLSERHAAIGGTQYWFFKKSNKTMDDISHAIAELDSNVLDLIGAQIKRILSVLPRDLNAMIPSIDGPYIEEKELMSTYAIMKVRELVKDYGLQSERAELSKHLDVYKQFIHELTHKEFLVLKGGKEQFEPYGRYVLDVQRLEDTLSKIKRIESYELSSKAEQLCRVIKDLPQSSMQLKGFSTYIREYMPLIRQYQFDLFAEGADPKLFSQEDVLTLLTHYDRFKSSLLELSQSIKSYLKDPSKSLSIKSEEIRRLLQYLSLVSQFVTASDSLLQLEDEIKRYFEKVVTFKTFKKDDKALLLALPPIERKAYLETLAIAQLESTLAADMSRGPKKVSRALASALISEGIDLTTSSRFWALLKHPTPQKRAVLKTLVQEGLLDVSIMIAYLYSEWQALESMPLDALTVAQKSQLIAVRDIKSSIQSIAADTKLDDPQKIATVLAGNPDSFLFRRAMMAMYQNNIDWASRLLKQARRAAEQTEITRKVASGAIVPALVKQHLEPELAASRMTENTVLKMFNHSVSGAQEVLRRTEFSRFVTDDLLQYALSKPSLYLDAVIHMVQHGQIKIKGDKKLSPAYLKNVYELIDKNVSALTIAHCKKMSDTIICIGMEFPYFLIKFPLMAEFNCSAEQHLAMFSGVPMTRLETWFHTMCSQIYGSCSRTQAYNDWMKVIKNGFLSPLEIEESNILIMNLLGRDEDLPRDVIELFVSSDIDIDKILPKRSLLSLMGDYIMTPVNAISNNLTDYMLERKELSPEYRLKTIDEIVKRGGLTKMLSRYDLQEFETYAGKQSESIFDYIDAIMHAEVPEDIDCIRQICIIQNVMRNKHPKCKTDQVESKAESDPADLAEKSRQVAII